VDAREERIVEPVQMEKKGELAKEEEKKNRRDDEGTRRKREIERGRETLKRRTFPHEPPKMRPAMVGPLWTPDAQKLIKTATKLPTGVFCLLLLHYSLLLPSLFDTFFRSVHILSRARLI